MVLKSVINSSVTTV